MPDNQSVVILALLSKSGKVLIYFAQDFNCKVGFLFKVNSLKELSFLLLWLLCIVISEYLLNKLLFVSRGIGILSLIG